jgi:hypothetical protein
MTKEDNYVRLPEPDSALERSWRGSAQKAEKKLEEIGHGVKEIIKERRAEHVARDKEKRAEEKALGIPHVSTTEKMMSGAVKILGSIHATAGKVEVIDAGDVELIKLGNEVIVSMPKGKDLFFIRTGGGFVPTKIEKLNTVI